MTPPIRSTLISWFTSGINNSGASMADHGEHSDTAASLSNDFARELGKYGDDTVLECFNCGTCSAVCPLVDDSFPRKMIRYVQIGAKGRVLRQADDLWRCLHCGLCTRTCPREADPGEVILTLKRYVLDHWRRS